MKAAKITFNFQNKNYKLILFYNEGKVTSFIHKQLFKIIVLEPFEKEITYFYPFPGVFAAITMYDKKFYLGEPNDKNYLNILNKIFEKIKIQTSKLKNFKIEKL
jgi:hypothetical protein